MPRGQCQVDLAIVQWLRASDWVTRHRLYNKMKRMRTYFGVCRRLKKLMSPDELLEGAAMSMPLPDTLPIPLRNKTMRQLTLHHYWRKAPAKTKSSESGPRMQQLIRRNTV